MAENDETENMTFKEHLLEVLAKKEIRFLIIGGCNTVFTYGLFALLIFFHVQYLIANIIVYIIGIFNGFFWNKIFTFKSKQKSMSEFVRYISVYVVSFLLGNLFLYLLVDRLNYSQYIAGGVNIVFVVAISWFGHNQFSFRKT